MCTCCFSCGCSYGIAFLVWASLFCGPCIGMFLVWLDVMLNFTGPFGLIDKSYFKKHLGDVSLTPNTSSNRATLVEPVASQLPGNLGDFTPASPGNDNKSYPAISTRKKIHTRAWSRGFDQKIMAAAQITKYTVNNSNMTPSAIRSRKNKRAWHLGAET
eukprot:gnl/TRDRNA2_/TRDRNA2_165209_c0_seq3.p1 gnl/TRDRNA2_/TRDRNA2_165209_c0~~gnl/TRDRNA2_/TRDRNA2_165209_c0_seq3.p1  ORF type:complete len:159 (+),score=9.04 gnl/TRDRNA2_/TRDRNA2_165209_c0_seq3:21-497(+)